MGGALSHGGGLAAAIARHGGRPEDWLDVSTGINPRPWPVPQLPADVWHRLPEPEALAELEDAARQRYGVSQELEVVAAPGSQALIELLPRLLKGRSAIILSAGNGTYGEHGHCLEKAGWNVRQVARPGDVEAGDDMAVIVHPNNPDGHLWQTNEILALAARLGKTGGHVIVDEAFCDICPDRGFDAIAPSNMIIYRSFGKFFGLAGLRLGFAFCPAEKAAAIRNRLGPWPVAGPAIEIGRRALADSTWITQTRSWLARQSAALERVLEKSGLRIEGRHQLFLLAVCEDGYGLAEHLAAQRILVRHFPDNPRILRFGLPAEATGLARLAEALVRSRIRKRQQTGQSWSVTVRS